MGGDVVAYTLCCLLAGLVLYGVSCDVRRWHRRRRERRQEARLRALAEQQDWLKELFEYTFPAQVPPEERSR